MVLRKILFFFEFNYSCYKTERMGYSIPRTYVWSFTSFFSLIIYLVLIMLFHTRNIKNDNNCSYDWFVTSILTKTGVTHKKQSNDFMTCVLSKRLITMNINFELYPWRLWKRKYLFFHKFCIKWFLFIIVPDYLKV